jgi:peptidyl-Lys metalloendopeptidase
VLAPGQSFELTHDLAGVYNFTSSGAGEYQFSASNIFQYVDASGKLATVAADTQSHKLKVDGSLASFKGVPNHDRRGLRPRTVTFNGCTSTQQSQISTAASSAVTYAANAVTYLNGISSGTTRWTVSHDQAITLQTIAYFGNC